MPKDQRSYTTIDVARRLGVSLQTVQRWVDAGHLKAWKTLGGHRRIDASSADLLFKEQEGQIGKMQDTVPDTAAAEESAVVVVVDDDAMGRELLVMLARKALPEAKVVAAANALEALVIIGKLSPQIVITDIFMPHINGFEMIRTLLEDVASRPRLLIAVSALTQQELALRGKLPSGIELFCKPLEQERLVALIRKAA